MPAKVENPENRTPSNIPKTFVICDEDQREDLFALLNTNYQDSLIENVTFLIQKGICIFEVPATVKELTNLLGEDSPYSITVKWDFDDLLRHYKKK